MDDDNKEKGGLASNGSERCVCRWGVEKRSFDRLYVRLAWWVGIDQDHTLARPSVFKQSCANQL